MFSLFRPTRRGREATERRFRPALETLDERIVPTFGATGQSDHWLGFAAFPFDSRGRIASSVQTVILDDGSGNPGNLHVTQTLTTVDNTTETFDLGTILNLRGVYIDRISVTNGVTRQNGYVLYHMTNPLGQNLGREIDYTGGAGGSQFASSLSSLGSGSHVDIHANFSGDNNIYGGYVYEMGANSQLTVLVDGGSGTDNLQFQLYGAVRSGARLGVRMQGWGGADTITFDAASSSPTIEAGASVSVSLWGYHYGREDVHDGGNTISLRYAGRLDGQFYYNLEGSGDPDTVGIDLNLASDSRGAVGDGDYEDAYIGGGGGDDTLRCVVKGGSMVTFNELTVSGGDGYDTLTRANGLLEPAGGLPLHFWLGDVESVLRQPLRPPIPRHL
jgi:hypothetical protein